MADLLLCEPTELYNILNQVSKLSRLAEPNYLCLLDVRPKRLYDESHVITAMRVKKNCYLDLLWNLHKSSSTSPANLSMSSKGAMNASLACTTSSGPRRLSGCPSFVGDENKLLHIKIEDSSGSSLFSSFRHICHFMEIHLRLQSVILVFSTRGISRSSAAVVAFLMHYNEETLKRSWAHVKKCKNNMRPNRGLVAQLLEWEKVIHGEYITDISNPIY
ncbi:serine/threonine/tyrosine-interacting-like protein 1 isoform X2 [Meriones unguiculatus]|uniref:serine/threonine/tyrosine-interacting-like protein 1 isoform X2 n=1 Tax=Meriones unguiculatus TaxID=10047 RepID=UPI000B4F0071|nr:serine/threonine/tyrosine-interacting-like protein 1 isoform X2 [Meriones unguiculatus]